MALRTLTYINQTEGFIQELAAADEISLGKVTLVGVGGVALDGGGTEAVNFADPTTPQSLATKFYVDAAVTGFDGKASVRLATAAPLPANTAAGTGVGKTLTANANGALSVDGIAVAVGNRILVKDEVAGEDNGIYVVTDAGGAGDPFVLTRATDADQDAEVTAGMYTFSTEGTANDNIGWLLITDDVIVVDTTSLVFSEFSSVVVYTFDQGLSNTAGSIKVEVDTGANAQGAGAGGGSSGLEFDANTNAGKLRAAVHATGGVERTATGLAVKLADTTLNSSASGLTVLEAPKVENTIVADAAIAAGDPVCFATVNDRVLKGLANTDARARVIAVARTAAAAQGDPLEIVSAGPCAGVLSGATVNTPYYLGATGGLTTTLPGSGNRLVQVGMAKNATDLFVRIVDYGKKA